MLEEIDTWNKMLWHYTQILFAVAGLCTVLSFHKLIDKVGQVFFLMFGGASWMAFAASLLKITFKWGGSTSVVDYTYIPSTESPFIYLFGIMGFLMLLIGLVRAFELTYAPVVDRSKTLLGGRGRSYEDM